MKRLFIPLLFLLTLVFTSCEKNGPIASKILNFNTFTGVSTQCGINANVSYGATQSVTLKGADNLLEKVDMYVENGTLIIKMEFGFYQNNNIVVDIVLPEITFVEATGSGNVWVGSFTDMSDLWMKITGSGDIKTEILDLANSTLTTEITGSGNMLVQGQANVENITMTGSGDYEAHNMVAGYSHTKITGSGSAKVNVTTDLHVTISGSGDVYYKGQPTINVEILGSGKIINSN